jgi:hypothetical protein
LSAISSFEIPTGTKRIAWRSGSAFYAMIAIFRRLLALRLLWDAWESLEPMQRQHWLGTQLVSAYLRARGKVASHLFGFNVGLKAVPRERRRSQIV